MTALLAVAVAGMGLVDPAAPVFYADDEALLRGAAAFETVRIRGGRAAASPVPLWRGGQRRWPRVRRYRRGAWMRPPSR